MIRCFSPVPIYGCKATRNLQVGTYRVKLGDLASWAFDTEFLSCGSLGVSEDVQSVQFSNGSRKYSAVLERVEQLQAWLESHAYIKVLYGFNILCDLGSVKAFLGDRAVKAYKFRNQIVGEIHYKRFKAKVFDVMGLCHALALRRLEDCGKIVGVLKLPKPEWLGSRGWQSEAEHSEFVEYAACDAVITALIVRWLRSNFGLDAEEHASIASKAAQCFDLPRRFVPRKGECRVEDLVSGIERSIKNNTYAGRSEGFTTGFIPNAVYNDARILYGVNCAVTRALEIVGVEECAPKDLVVGIGTPLDDQRFGWLEGCFETGNDLFGLPLRADNNTFVTGRLSGWFSTFDLSAAKAKVLFVNRAFKPVFKPNESHDYYVEMLLDVLEGRLEKNQERYSKGLLRSLTGKFAQAKPVIAASANFYAYSAIVAHAHFLVSRMFDHCAGLGGKIYAMDTDSVFSNLDLSGKFCELSDGEHSIPVLFAVKARGDLVFFRSKCYLMRDKNGFFESGLDTESGEKSEGALGRHHWCYFYDDYVKLFDGVVTELNTRKDIKRTLLTHTKAALEMEWGRWLTVPEHLDLDKIKSLVEGDQKRNRENYDSYGLAMTRKNAGSSAWNVDDLLRMTPNLLGYPKIEKRQSF